MPAPAIGIALEEVMKYTGLGLAAAAAWLSTRDGQRWATEHFGAQMAETVTRAAQSASYTVRRATQPHGTTNGRSRSVTTAESDATRTARPEIVTPVRRSGTSGAYALETILGLQGTGSRVMQGKKNKDGKSGNTADKKQLDELAKRIAELEALLAASQAAAANPLTDPNKGKDDKDNKDNKGKEGEETPEQKEARLKKEAEEAEKLKRLQEQTKKKSSKYLTFWEGSGNASSHPNLWRYVRNGIRLGLYTEGTAGGLDFLGNSIASAKYPDHDWDWRLFKVVNTPFIGGYNAFIHPYVKNDLLGLDSTTVIPDTVYVTTLPPAALQTVVTDTVRPTTYGTPAPVTTTDSATLKRRADDWNDDY